MSVLHSKSFPHHDNIRHSPGVNTDVMIPSPTLSIRIIALTICFLGAVGVPVVTAQPEGPAPTATPETKPKGESAKVNKISKLQQRVEMDDVEWQAITPVIGKVMLLSRQLRDLRDTNHSLAMKAPRNNGLVDPSRPAPAATPAWLLELTDKAAALRAASEDPTLRPAEVEARLVQFHAARTRAEQQLSADLAGARQELRELVTARQELILTLNGLLD
jgi:hypothetical protein